MKQINKRLDALEQNSTSSSSDATMPSRHVQTGTQWHDCLPVNDNNDLIALENKICDKNILESLVGSFNIVYIYLHVFISS
jgi:hypothetical protein